MAQLITNNTSKRTFYSDLTPLADIAFLLISFFVLTTEHTKPSVMSLFLPRDYDQYMPSLVGADKTITLFPGENNRIYYYEGLDHNNLSVTDYSADGIRKILLTKQMNITTKYGSKNGFFVYIKPTDESVYKNVVDLLDEMLINGVKRYMLVQPTQDELNNIENKKINLF